jgi:small subunit ribosomal protein S7
MKNSICKENIFNCQWLSKFINCISFNGKKFKIEKLVFYGFFLIKKILNTNGLLCLFETLEQLKPWVGLKLRRNIKQRKSQIQAHPIILTTKIQHKKAIYWLVKSIQIRKELTFYSRMVNEVKNVIFSELTYSLKKKKDYYNYAITFKSVRKFKW